MLRLYTNQFFYKKIYNSFIWQIITVNGAELLVRDIVGSNGVLYIIDRMLAPVSSAKTLHDYLLYPDLPGYQFQYVSLKKKQIIKQKLVHTLSGITWLLFKCQYMYV